MRQLVSIRLPHCTKVPPGLKTLHSWRVEDGGKGGCKESHRESFSDHWLDTRWPAVEEIKARTPRQKVG